MPAFPFTLLFLLTLTSGILAFLFQRKDGSSVKFFLSFSGAFLLSTCFVHLLPEIFDNKEVNVAPYILGGFFLQILIEFFSKGVEHGHVHEDGRETAFPALVFAGLCIHSFIEGLPLAGVGDNQSFVAPLFWGIVLHNIPISFILLTLFKARSIKPGLIVASLVFFSSLAPLAGLAGQTIMAHTRPELLIVFLALSTGIFLHISTVILFESSRNHTFNLIKFAFIAAGGLLPVLLF